mmetsp:Transcript_71680/g.167870  ORF Transcript_71680/g.167870 Transcript_71680/m.167870 type:complete len:304 (-) Transcript_71680:385-1296(-)
MPIFPQKGRDQSKKLGIYPAVLLEILKGLIPQSFVQRLNHISSSEILLPLQAGILKPLACHLGYDVEHVAPEVASQTSVLKENGRPPCIQRGEDEVTRAPSPYGSRAVHAPLWPQPVQVKANGRIPEIPGSFAEDVMSGCTEEPPPIVGSPESLPFRRFCGGHVTWNRPKVCRFWEERWGQMDDWQLQQSLFLVHNIHILFELSPGFFLVVVLAVPELATFFERRVHKHENYGPELGPRKRGLEDVVQLPNVALIKQEPAVRFGARLRQGDHIFDKAIEQARSDGSLQLGHVNRFGLVELLSL